MCYKCTRKILVTFLCSFFLSLLSRRSCFSSRHCRLQFVLDTASMSQWDMRFKLTCFCSLVTVSRQWFQLFKLLHKFEIRMRNVCCGWGRHNKSFLVTYRFSCSIILVLSFHHFHVRRLWSFVRQAGLFLARIRNHNL